MIHELAYPASTIWLAAGAVTLLTSGLIVKVLLQAAGEPTPEGAAGPGFVIGKVENVLILALVSLGAYTAWAWCSRPRG